MNANLETLEQLDDRLGELKREVDRLSRADGDVVQLGSQVAELKGQQTVIQARRAAVLQGLREERAREIEAAIREKRQAMDQLRAQCEAAGNAAREFLVNRYGESAADRFLHPGRTFRASVDRASNDDTRLSRPQQELMTQVDQIGGELGALEQELRSLRNGSANNV